MDSQSFNYWLSHGSYVPPQQAIVFDLPPDLSKVPSLSESPVSSTFDQFPTPVPQVYYPQTMDEPVQFGSYPLPMTPSDLGSDRGSPYSSPRPLPHTEQHFAQIPISVPAERVHTTSGRRRAQNRAAQRAFRERKEQHARNLEIQLETLTDKYSNLEVSHLELNIAYEKLRKTIELLTQDDDADGEDEDGQSTRRRNNNSDTLRKLLDILHGEFKGTQSIKAESV
ncbi:hypothetical protein P153DRAFT_117959 [Dothidotthia symphoricarpi CBS 119687]|uniref:Putative transcription factor kapC n=1 Tax=Dothidotthia symphoricarpi CBS 119687 TaxID=1392245 RepID=A0A6A6A1D3_9PLEO|nr:uncharacterized protein P153DRAFT_117959 [Dothidotthia symphoricarpi CBS 119687]KAF2125005.1 hypothetical protein P153DRAFT_117959 [Dothidotthia symphoricarpi CBS 119687]